MSRRSLVGVLVVILGACGSKTTFPDGPLAADGGGGADAVVADAPPIDAMVDAAPDAMVDAAPDAAMVDAMVDAAPDAAMVDAPVDAPPPDAPPIDAAPDAPVDAGPDAPVDAPPPDAPPFTNGASTLAGTDAAGYVDGARNVNRFDNPVNVALGPDGRIYVADFSNGAIRAVDTTGNTETIYTATNFQRPFGLAFDTQSSALYVSTDNDDTGAHDLLSGTIWKIDVTNKTATVVVHDVGRPRGIAVLPDGRLVLVDWLHHTVSLLDPANNNAITLIAGAYDVPAFADGAGADARFANPVGVTIVSGPAIAIADFNNNRIRLVQLDGTTSTIAGDGTAAYLDGAAATAQLSHPEGLAVDAAGDLFITDTGNYRIRKLSGGQVSTVAGDGTAGFLDADDPLMAEFYGLEGLCSTSDGKTLYVADGTRGDAVPYNRIRQVLLP